MMDSFFQQKHQFCAAMVKKSTAGISSGQNHSSAGRSVQIYPGIRSDVHLVENFGYQLPILVNEALTFNEKNQSVSIKYAANSWAWVVHGRRLLIWQYKELSSAAKNSPVRRNKEFIRASQRRGAYTVPQCRELTLPHCDIGHKASLINVFLNEGQQMASCIAVSPTGDVRFWPSIAHDGSSTDLNGILDGQEFDQLVDMPQQGYLLVTTTCNLVFISMQLVNGRHVLQHKPLKQACGFLGGFGKKFASIIIGLNNGAEKEYKFVSINCDRKEESGVVVTLLADRSIQRWRLDLNVQQLIYEDTDIIRRMRDEFQQKYWNIRDPVDVELHLLEMQLYGGKHYVLAGAVNSTHTPQMFYGIVVLSSEAGGMQMVDFIPLKLTQFYDNNTKKACLSLRFIICGSYLFLYNEKTVYPLNLLQNTHMIDMEGDKIEFNLHEDAIMSAAVCEQIPIFFSRSHGLLSVTPGDFDSTDNHLNAMSTSAFDDKTLYDSNLSMSGGGASKNLYMLGLDPETMCNELKDDDVSQMKAAFVYRLKGNNNMCNTIVNKLMRNIMQEYERTNNVTGFNPLENVVLTIAQDLADDIPAADPRWEQMRKDSAASKHHALGSSVSLQILTQLKEKSLALRHFVEFLHGTGIWEKLDAVAGTSNSSIRPVSLQISDISEKIAAAIALKKVQNKYSKIIDEAINHTVCMWRDSPLGNLTAQDVFFVRLSKFQEIFHSLSQMAQKRVSAQMPTSIVMSFLVDVNAIALSVISRILKHREQSVTLFALPTDNLENYEYLPWTAASGETGLRDALMRLIDLSVRFGAHSTAELDLKQKVYQQIAELIDLVLAGKKQYVDSVRDGQKRSVMQQQFETQRRELISILIEDGQYDYAMKLAERYLDFHSLIIICDRTKNQERLDTYITKYERYNFSQYAINWHLRQNRQGEVFERFKGNETALSQFMHDHPSLGWIQLMFNGNFERAANVLFQLAQNETELVLRKKSMLSLAKLATFAAADSDLTTQVAHINAELNVIDYQEQLDGNVLESLGYDVSNQRVLKVDEIIRLFIADENENVSEFDFRKSLELLRTSTNDMPTEDLQELRLRIWCAAIMRDNWIDYDNNNAIDYLQNLVFFKLVELCHLIDGDVETFLPPVEEFLNSSELDDLPQKNSFQYLIKLAYEHIMDLFSKANDSKAMNL